MHGGDQHARVSRIMRTLPKSRLAFSCNNVKPDGCCILLGSRSPLLNTGRIDGFFSRVYVLHTVSQSVPSWRIFIERFGLFCNKIGFPSSWYIANLDLTLPLVNYQCPFHLQSTQSGLRSQATSCELTPEILVVALPAHDLSTTTIGLDYNQPTLLLSPVFAPSATLPPFRLFKLIPVTRKDQPSPHLGFVPLDNVLAISLDRIPNTLPDIGFCWNITPMFSPDQMRVEVITEC